MLHEPTTIAAAARLIAETLEKNYGVDYQPLFKKVGLDLQRLDVSGARYPWRSMEKLWLECGRVTGDPAFGLAVGASIRPTTFHALGFSWIASRTLLEALQRLCRYSHLLSNAPYQPVLHDAGKVWLLEHTTLEKVDPVASIYPRDALFVAIIKLCKQARDSSVVPLEVGFRREAPDDIAIYTQAFEAPVYFGRDADALVFEKEVLEAPLPGDNLELAIAHDRIAEEYISALQPERVASEVRALLIKLLPSGNASQDVIARQMNRSLSTLQRQLAAEGTNYKEIRELTRAELAEKYVREGRYSLSQVAYLLGFSDQSNFSRAFRRWTGQSPGNYRQ